MNEDELLGLPPKKLAWMVFQAAQSYTRDDPTGYTTPMPYLADLAGRYDYLAEHGLLSEEYRP